MMVNNMNKTKIIATIGPASSSKDTIKQLVVKGMNVVRINLSHADEDFCRNIVRNVAEVNKELNTYIPIIFDLKGPDIRIGNITGDEAFLSKGSKIRIYMDDVVGDSTKFSIDYNLIKDIKTNNIIKIGESSVELKVIEKGSNYILCEVLNEGFIQSHKTISIPNVKLNIPFLSEYDKKCIYLADELKVDFLALSFVSDSEQVLKVNDLLIELGNDHIGIISKIENQSGIDDIDEIIKISDGIMVARGDLGMEIPLERVPIVSKMITNKCHIAGKICIIATELLSSMQNVNRPTRAEVSDVANAVIDSVDAVMLSGETTIGKYPIETVEMMHKIIASAEENIDYLSLLDRSLRSEKQDITGTLAYSVIECADRLKARCIVALTVSGYTARKMSRFRPVCPIIAISPNIETVKNLALYFGVYPILIDELNSLDKIIAKSKQLVMQNMNIKNGDKVIITGGYPFKTIKHTNFMKIEEL